MERQIDSSIVDTVNQSIAQKRTQAYLEGKNLDELKARIINKSLQGSEMRIYGETSVGKTAKMRELVKNALAVATMIAIGVASFKGLTDRNTLDTYRQAYTQETGEHPIESDNNFFENLQENARTLKQIEAAKDLIKEENPNDYFLGINLGAGPDENGNYSRLNEEAAHQVAMENAEMAEERSKGGK